MGSCKEIIVTHDGRHYKHGLYVNGGPVPFDRRGRTDCQDIPVGQRRLLVHSIVGTFPLGPTAASSDRDRNANGTNQNTSSTGPCAPQNANCSQPDQTTGPSPEVQENEFIRNVLGQLHGPIPTSDTGMVSWQDPQIYLKSLTTSNNKVILILLITLIIRHCRRQRGCFQITKMGS